MKSKSARSSAKPKPVRSKASGQRIRATPKYRSFRLSKKRLKQHQPIPGVIRLFKDSFRLVGSHKRLFAGITGLNFALSLIFIQGLGSLSDLTQQKQDITDQLQGQSDQLGTAVTLFSDMISSAGTAVSETAGVYQVCLTLITGLALIWAIRQIQAGQLPGIRESYYKGMYPLIPFILVVLVIGIQLIPLVAGNLIYTTVVQNDLAVTIAEKAVWLLLFLLLGLLSVYMLASSLFSLYIVTLPEMTPLRALRSARELVLHRRVPVMMRIIALPLVLSAACALIFIPLIIVAVPVAQVAFLFLTSVSLALVHSYMYLLYRSLL